MNEQQPTMTEFREVAEDEQQELVEEMAATSTLNELFDECIVLVGSWFAELTYVSEEGNPVKTHIEIVSTAEDVLTEMSNLKQKLIESLAKRGDDVKESGMLLRKQVIDSEES